MPNVAVGAPLVVTEPPGAIVVEAKVWLEVVLAFGVCVSVPPPRVRLLRALMIAPGAVPRTL